MNTIERIKNILLTPKTEWAAIAPESSTTAELMKYYVAPLAGVAAVCGFIGTSIVGFSVPVLGTMRTPIMEGIGITLVSFLLAFVGVYILSLVIDGLAPTFGGQKNHAQALKVAVYSYTPAWIAGVLQIFPGLTILGALLSLYGLYLLYLGLPRLMNNPQEKSVGYTAVVVICAILIGYAIALVSGLFAGVTGALQSDRAPATAAFEKNSPMGKLEDFGKKMDEVNQKMEAAQKSGDPQAQVKAAMEGLGAAIGGGKRFDPVAIDQLKPLLPESFVGLPRKNQSAERGGIAGLETASAEADYGDGGGRRAKLEITDTGGAAGLMGLAGWMAQGERESDHSRERTRKEGDRLVHERVSTSGGENEFSLTLGNRFLVQASGYGVGIDELKSAVAALDLGKLEAMKDVGAQK
jgi:uncharacterized membrane protein